MKTWTRTCFAVLEFPEISSYIESHANAKDEILKYLKEMATEINFRIGTKASFLLQFILKNIYEGVYTTAASSLDLSKLASEAQIIFVPNHQSHADYLVFNNEIFRRFGIAAYTIAGDNLNLPGVGSLLKQMGSIFIRRKFKDNAVYKMTFKAFLLHLMRDMDHPLEFYFEGGRSRNGMLLTPKFGMFKFLLENQDYLTTHYNNTKPLAFVPVSIVHERLAEEKALAAEVFGQEKSKESLLQLALGLRVLFRKLGAVTIRIGEPIYYKGNSIQAPDEVERIAFACYREVAQGIVVTPISLFALAALDSPERNLTLNIIMETATQIIAFCKRFKIPLAPSLEKENWQQALQKKISDLCSLRVVKKIYLAHLGDYFYTMQDSKRVQLTYFKNTVLHHFLVPFLFYLAWVKLRNNQLKTEREIIDFFLERRKELKYEFYLPSTSKMWQRAYLILSDFLGRPVKQINEWLELSTDEKAKFAQTLSYAGYFFRYKYEAYYIAMLTLEELKSKTFSKEVYLKTSFDIFTLEKMNGNIIKFPESYSKPVMENTLNYSINTGLAIALDKEYKVCDISAVRKRLDLFLRDLFDIYRSNFG